MNVVVISPEHIDPRETAVLSELFAAGLERYHVRKPAWSRDDLASWLRTLPPAWRSRLVLHQHHELAEELGLGGIHHRDSLIEGGAGSPSRPGSQPAFAPQPQARSESGPHLTSRACHDLPTLRAALGRYDSVFFSPVFPSISKPGHAPRSDLSFDDLTSLLANRTPAERRTTVLALGGIDRDTAPRALALGFDGVAVLGAIWQSADPVRAYREIAYALQGRDARPARPSRAQELASPSRTAGPAVPTCPSHA